MICAVRINALDEWVKEDRVNIFPEYPARKLLLQLAVISSPFVHRFIMAEDEPAVLHIPAGWANGSKALMEGTQVVHFSSMTVDEAAGDDLRWPWDAIPGAWEEQQR